MKVTKKRNVRFQVFSSLRTIGPIQKETFQYDLSFVSTSKPMYRLAT